MMLAVLLFSYIIFINLPSSITINGYEEAIKRQINAEDTNPSIIEGKLSNSTNHLASQIKYDFKLKAIYILTYQKSEVGMIKDSKLYYCLLTDLYFTLIELKKPNLDFQFTRIEAGPEIIVGVSEMKNLIAISTNLGKDWIVNFLKFDGVDQIVISQQNRDHIAIVSKKGEIYLIIEFGARRSLQAYYGAQPIWPSISESLYLLEKSRFDTNIYVTKTDYISLRPSIVLKQAIDFGQSGNIIWVVTKDENKAHIHFIEKNDEVNKAHFPKFLKPKNFYPFNSNSQIFTIVINETNGVFFYTASTTDLRFIRIGDNIRPSFNSSIELCIAVETFEYLPGVLIMNMETISNEHQKIFTAISYNYGLKWTHILPPKTIKDLSCIWPSCYLKLTLECIKNNKNNSIIFSEKLPSLMISSGIIYRNNVEDYSSLFLSQDAGYSWVHIPSIITSVHILNYGSILLGLPDMLYSFYYSYDLGHTWKYSTLEGNSLIPIKTFHDSSSSSILTTIITFNDSTKEWGFIKIDFTHTLKKDCDIIDYEIYTPGLHDKSTCFQGQKQFTLRRKHDVKCKTLLDKLPKIQPDICQCTQDDFSCTFGHYFINGQCLKDLDESKILDICVPGEISIIPSKKKKLEDDICKSNGNWSAKETDICKFTAQDNLLSVLIGSTIKYIYFDGNEKQEFTNLPIDLTHVGNIYSYSINFNRRCLYVLNETGIIQFCYNKNELSFINSEEMFLKDYSILGMRLDQSSNDIFYYGLKYISIINEISKYTKIIYNSQYDITYVNLFPTLGIILYSYIITYPVPNKYCVDFLSMNGEMKFSICYDAPINAVSLDAQNEHYVIFFKGFVSRVDYNYEFVEKKVEASKDILAAYVNGKKIYFITKNGIFFEKNAIYNSHITYGYFHFVEKTEPKSPCLFAHCDIFCFITSSVSYECGCPNNMVFNKTILKCVCDASHHHCTACKSNEYHCENHKCVPIYNRCNRVDNCGDSSDEKNCPMTCEIDELLCDNDSMCVFYTNICDGVKNCEDGKDELNCHKVSKCNQRQYRCLNGDCILKTKYCDSNKDCSDNSDEESCLPGCKYFEARCNNGDCVMKNQLCDNNFDCADLSDEHGCDLIVDATINISCLIKCDNKCIPHDNVCNHISDCSDGKDELNCKNKALCSSEGMLNCNSYHLCYELFRNCDGFKDCSDGVDEANCEKTDLCLKSDIFKCHSMQKCISINDRCDGKYDCVDRSDEENDCLYKNYIKKIKIKSMQDGNLELIWVTNKKSTGETYYVSFIGSETNISFIDKIVTDEYLIINGLSICNKYTVTVKSFGSSIRRNLQFTYINSQTKSPKDIEYDYSRFLLKWSYFTEYCLSIWFYIECVNGGKIVLQNFSTNIYLIVPYNSELACRVSTCPLNVFNISCSSFSSTIYLEVYSPYYKLKITCIVLILLIIIACIPYFFKRNRKFYFSSWCWKNKYRIKKDITITYVVNEIYE